MLGRAIILGATLMYAAAVARHGAATAYFAVLNDFWGNAFAATHWSWNARQQWNGFFPPGYPTILTLLPGPRLVESAYFLNVASGAALLAVVAGFARTRLTSLATFCALAVVALHPVVLTQVLTIGPDAAFVAVAVIGALMAFSLATKPAGGWAMPILVGSALGASCWIRFHGLTWAPAVLGSAAVVGGRQAWRPLLRAGLVFAIYAAVLGILGVAAGDLSAITRDQAFNVYSRLVHPVNWFHLDREPIPATLAAAVARDPEAFWRNYLTFSAPHLWLAVGCLLAGLSGRGESRRFALFALFTGLAFVPVVNLGASPRGIACFVPMVLVAVVWAFADAVSRLAGPARAMATGVLLAVGCAYVWILWIPDVRDYVAGARARATASAEMESLLRRDRVVLGRQVFAVADFYFVHAPGWQVGNYYPWIKGGWPTLDLPGFLEAYPPPATDSLDHFLDDCQRFGITHVVLSDAAGAMFRELGQLFDGRLSSERVLRVGEVAGMRAYRILK